MLFRVGAGGRAAIAPGAHPAGIDMHEARAGIIAYTATAKREGGIAQVKSVNSRDADIDGVRLHVKTILRDAGRMGTEEFIAPRGAKATDDLNFGVWMTHGTCEIGKNVEDAGIVMLHLAGAVVAKEMVELSFRFRKIEIAAAIDDINAFAGMSVVEAKMMLL